MAASKMYQELRVVMVGKTGIGKSSLGNSLLQKKCFKASLSAVSVTESCKVGQKKLDDDSNLMVIDTPGLFDTGKPNEESIKEITKCIGLASPGPHIFIFVLNVTRVTPEELKAVDHLMETFGDAVIDYIIIVFTGKDKFDNNDDDDNYDDDDDEEENTNRQNPKNITEYVENIPQYLRDFASGQCKGRFTAICNKSKHPNHMEDVQNVIDLIMKTIRNNNEQFYTTKMLKAAEAAIQAELEYRSSDGIPASREEVASEKGDFWKKFLEVVKIALSVVSTAVIIYVKLK